MNSLKSLQHYDRIVYWVKTISLTGLMQVIVQILGFLCGILVIRLLSMQEYALYTLANTMLGTMTVLADGGIYTGVMAEGGKVWKNPEKLGAVLVTGLDLRRKFAIGSLIISIPILLYLLLDNGASWFSAILITLSIIPAFYAFLSDSLLEIVPKLHQSIFPLQKNEVSVASYRLILSTLTLFIFPWAFLAILASGLTRLYGNFELKKISQNFVLIPKSPDSEIRKEILKVVKRVLPGAIFYSLSGQLTIWLIAVFGTTSSIAELGAIGRLAMLLSVFSSLFSTLLIPRFARLKDDSSLLLKQFILALGLLLLVCVLVIGVFLVFSEEVLWLLGNNYSDLTNELILSVVGSCIGLFTALIFSLSSSRGWVLNPYLYISVSLIAIITGILFFDISSLNGVLVFNIFISAIQAIMYLLYTFFKIKKG
ncbi:polysaccharide biosynthesis protein [Algibacter aquimarinus]|uniref:Polysaccharide biosynthesis protein n=1 Tax=Algibacter aquimarinus TaxID=1136748 RepID=A0ABP9HRH5_9FLAO